MMRPKSKGQSATEIQYQFETALPMDEAMQRLHNQMGQVREGLLRIKQYKLSSGNRRDSIYFEIVRRPTRFSHKLVLTGTIREISQNRTVLECQVRRNNPIRYAALWALPLFLTIVLVATYRGPFQLQEAIFFSPVLTGVLLFVSAPKRFPPLGADDIERIESAIGGRQNPE